MAYEDRAADELILRDHLAIHRTNLANERTLLAYVRTAFMLLIAGGTAIKALPDDVIVVGTGWLLLALGGTVALFGALRFRATRRQIESAAN